MNPQLARGGLTLIEPVHPDVPLSDNAQEPDLSTQERHTYVLYTSGSTGAEGREYAPLTEQFLQASSVSYCKRQRIVFGSTQYHLRYLGDSIVPAPDGGAVRGDGQPAGRCGNPPALDAVIRHRV